MLDSRYSDNEVSRRDIPSFIEPRPPLISNPFMRPRPQKGTNLLELFEEDSECEEPELVQVYLRLKPCNNPSNLYEVRSDRYLITSLDTTTAGHGRRTQQNVSKMFTFSHIFGPETNQKEIFENVVKDNLKKLPEGNSFTLLTYGASGSGKTFTLMGTVTSPGLVPRSLEYVFKVVDAAQSPVYKPSETGADKLSYAQQDYELQCVKRLQVSAPLKDKYRRMSVKLRNDLTASYLDLRKRSRHYVWVSFIEIYNEGIYDLLAPGQRRNAQKLAIREDSSGNVYVKGATQVFVRSGEEAYAVMVSGKHNLQVAATGVHAHSSRSHCIFTITMLTEGEGGVCASHVRLCDLAGCERAARTRNTGARMCESRAINSSLHVLERCLRALRGRTRAPARPPVVPYRESKLTRLLGSGLSGARGEAVGMVVTLSPSPEYANETKHVLQLAAVAKDIQINNTLSEYPSTLETSQDITMGFSTEVMKLRSDNERLHFELIQAQARNRELQASMEQRQAAGAETMRELVSEAREITANYYEEQLGTLRDQMAEMVEEYETRLNTAQINKSETPSRSKDTKINQLMTEIAILEEKLQAEKLARQRAEEEVQHLRACIEERDEKPEEEDTLDPIAEDVSLTDSDISEDEDPCNESLEPTFKKENVNRSRLNRQSAISVEDSASDNSALNKTSDTLKDESREVAYETNEDISGDELEYSARESFDNPESQMCTVKKMDIRGTYFVEENIGDDLADVDTKLSKAETYCVADDEQIIDKSQLQPDERGQSLGNNDGDDGDNEYRVKPEFGDVKETHQKEPKEPSNFVNKIINSIKDSSASDSNNSLAQFERLEMASNESDAKPIATDVFSDIRILKEKRNFFDVEDKSPATKERKIFFDNLNEEPKAILEDVKQKIDEYRSPSIVKDDVTVDFTPSMIKKLLGESKRQAGLGSVHQVKAYTKTHESLDLFEDSPRVLLKIDENVESVRKSVANIVISENVETSAEELLIDGNIKNICNVNVVDTRSDGDAITNDNIIKSVDIKNTETNVIDLESDIQTIKRSESPLEIENPSKHLDMKLVKNEETKLDVNDLIGISFKPKKSHFDDITTAEVKETKSPENSVVTSGSPKIKEENHHVEVKNEDITKLANNDSQTDTLTNVNNTIEDFDNIYKDITAPRATDFDLLVSQENSEYSIAGNDKSRDNDDSDVKYNLRRKKSEKKKIDTEKPTRMNLRLRRRKNLSEEDDSEKETKLKDILNFQSEFSDVTMDTPAVPSEPTKDIPSPEKIDENQPPMCGIQSCPSKSVVRSRRKLFTPRAEAPEEGAPGDSAERVRVPRPSYHRPRARRKL